MSTVRLVGSPIESPAHTIYTTAVLAIPKPRPSPPRRGSAQPPLYLVLLLTLLTGCVAAIQAEDKRITGKLTRAGLQERQVPLGPETTMQVWEGGSGPTVVLLHGFGPSAPWQWHTQVRAFAKHHRVIVPNLLWFGQSTGHPSDASLVDQVGALAKLLDVLEVEETALVGVSYGGLVAVALARMQPEMVSKLVIVDSPARVYERSDYDALLQRFEVSEIQEVLIPETEADVARLLGLAYHSPPWTNRGLRKAILATLYANHRKEQAALLRTLVADMEMLSNFGGFSPRPTLVVWGRDDPVFPLAMGEALAESIPARLEVIERARHTPNMEHPRHFNRVVLDFLAEP